jgi:hypothetical protein
LNSVQLIQQQIQLEYRLNSDGFLVPFPGSTEQARFIIYRHTDGYVTYFRHDLPRSIREALATLPPEHAFTNPKRSNGFSPRARFAMKCLSAKVAPFRTHRPPHNSPTL